jgi:predicted esterase
MILLHGRNAGPENILELAVPLAHSRFCFLAPAAANRSWYPLSFLSPREQNEPFLSSALAVVADLIEAIHAHGVPAARIMLLGFSQGACLALETASRRASPDRLGGVIGLSGGLIGPPGTSWTFSSAMQGMPVLLGCSDVDSHIPKARVEETARMFESAGARVTLRLYPGMGHLVNAEELELTRTIMAEVAGSAG